MRAFQLIPQFCDIGHERLRSRWLVQQLANLGRTAMPKKKRRSRAYAGSLFTQVNSSKADADDPKLIEPVKLAAA